MVDNDGLHACWVYELIEIRMQGECIGLEELQISIRMESLTLFMVLYTTPIPS